MPANCADRQRGWGVSRRLTVGSGGAALEVWNIEQARAGWSRRAVLLGGLAAASSPEGDRIEGEPGRVARVMDRDALTLDAG